MKIVFATIALILASITAVGGYVLGVNSLTPKTQTVPEDQYKFSQEVENILSEKLKQLTAISSNPVVISGVQKSNKDNQKLTQALINQMDQNWRKNDADSDVIKPFLTNTVAVELSKFQETHRDLEEIFVTDQRGLNVGQTNKTSDYFQSDEEWWTDAYDSGKGRSYYGEIEFDESSQTEAVALYAPIVEPGSGKVIGIIKALLNINAVKLEI